MSATASSSEPQAANAMEHPPSRLREARVSGAAFARQRAEGRIVVEARAFSGVTRAMRVGESGAARLRLPRSEHGLDAVMLNVAGGLACGDRMSVEIDAGPGAGLTLSTPGAERVYRSDGPVTEVATRLSVGAAARLGWIPQETILFDNARLMRRLDADIAEDASLTIYEGVGFGRQARGETISEGLLEDRWRIRRGGRLVFAETLLFDGAVHETLQRRTVAAGMTSLATIVHVAPDAEEQIEAVRRAFGMEGVEAGVTAWNGLLVARILSASAERLRDAARSALPILLGRPLPRVWTC